MTLGNYSHTLKQSLETEWKGKEGGGKERGRGEGFDFPCTSSPIPSKRKKHFRGSRCKICLEMREVTIPSL